MIVKERMRPDHWLGQCLQFPTVYWHVGWPTDGGIQPAKPIPLIAMDLLKEYRFTWKNGSYNIGGGEEVS